MQARDLRRMPPRRWSDTLDGIPWLPRLIDKARAVQAGTLGAYLYGQSPMDRSLLRALGLGHRSFASIVAQASDDDGVAAGLAARDPQSLDRARAWGSRLARDHGWFLYVIDVDDGYAQSGALHAIKPAVTAAANALTWALKRVWPYRA
jgi:hypothetical protein